MPQVKQHLPLLSVLRKLGQDERQIVVDHLDKNACNTLQFCLSKVLKEGKKSKKTAKLMTKLVRENKKNFETILGLGKKKKLSHKQKRLALAKIGGNPLALILSTAVPLLLNMLRR